MLQLVTWDADLPFASLTRNEALFMYLYIPPMGRAGTALPSVCTVRKDVSKWKCSALRF